MSNQESTSPGTLHRLRPLVPRDPNEKGRSSSPLELLFDLTFAAAFSVAGTQFAELLAKG
ncbi:low temperature requirement protein A [Enemella evansiae]|nr:low temperature requirement protein A [Enemella evansiae]